MGSKFNLQRYGSKFTHCPHSRYVVGLVFGFEHLLLVAAVVLQWSIQPVPKWVRIAVRRREYLAMKRKAAAAAAAEDKEGHREREGEGMETRHRHGDSKVKPGSCC